jgi:hypothetical protein
MPTLRKEKTMADRIEGARPMVQEVTVAAGGQAPGSRVPRDVRTLRRIATAISIVLGPLAVGVVRATVASGQDSKAIIAAVMAHPDMARVELAAGVIATLFLPFAMIGLTRLVMRRAPVLAMLGGSLALVGWAMVPALIVGDAMTYEMAQSGANSTQFAALLDHVQGNFAVTMFFSVFIIGHELGTLLLGIGLARARVVPLWAAAAVVIGIVLHPVSVVLGIRLVDILAFALIVAGCAAAARAVLITPNDAWDLPPLAVRGAARREV